MAKQLRVYKIFLRKRFTSVVITNFDMFLMAMGFVIPDVVR